MTISPTSTQGPTDQLGGRDEVAETHETATKVATLLGDPKSFLLFIFCVLALFEYSSWRKTYEYSNIIVQILENVESNRTREMDANYDTIRELIKVVAQKGYVPESVVRNVPPAANHDTSKP
jgi:hypothetical protein